MPKGRKRAAASRGNGKNKRCKKASETPVAISSDNLNNGASAVTNMNMVFPTAENNFIIENTNPVGSSIGFLSSTDTTSNVLFSPAANVTINASNDSLVEPNLLCNMANNFPIDTGIQTELDDEIQIVYEDIHVTGNLNNNSSAVTNMNMRFPTAERENADPVASSSANADPVASSSANAGPVASSNANADPVASSIASLPPTDTLSNLLSLPAENISKSLHLHKFLDSLLDNVTSNDFLVEPGLFPDIENNFPINTENQDQLDGNDDVQIIGVHKDVEEVHFNPDVILNLLMEQCPELKEIVERTRYVSDAFVVQLYASLNKDNKIGKYSKLTVDLRKCKSRLKNALEEIKKLKGLKVLEAEFKELKIQNQSLEKKLELVQNNASMVISSLRSAITKNIEEKLEAEYLATLNEKDQKLKESEEKVNNLKEKVRCLKKEIEESEMLKKKRLEEEQKIKDELNAAKLQISPRIISEYKRKHYCRVCDRPAAIVCCLNTTYCSIKCQERQAKEHRKHCTSKM